jgi:UDP-GlcNAc:undecaprenyl-phosphate GlcNAc-1-phosphate transferase
MTRVVLAGGFAFIAGLLLTVLVKRLALRVGAVAMPKADRWHRTRIPLMGGLAIAGAVVAGAAVVPIRDPGMLLLLGGGLTMLAVGALDDARPLKPQSKLVAQIVVAAALAGLGLQLRLTAYPPLDVVVTIVWIVGITNAINLLDNMDGLAAGIAAIMAAFRVAFYLLDGNTEGAAFAAAVFGALAGFLVHNFNPASIFMGDAGSLFLGVMVSGLSLVGGWPYSRGVVSVLLFPVLILLVPIFDTTFVTVARTLAGRPISMGGRDHTSHRLVALGMTERAAVLLLYLVAVVAGGLAYASYRYGLSQTVVLIGFLGIGLSLFGVYLGRLQVYPEAAASADDGRRLVRRIGDFSYLRQIGTVCIDALLVVLAYYGAYLLRFEGRIDAESPAFVQSLPVVIVCQIGAFALFRVYQGMWRYTSVRDFLQLARAATVGTVTAVVALLLLTRFEGYSRAVFVIDWLLLVTSVGAARLSFRALAETLRNPPPEGGRRVLIYGAGDGGVMVLREILNNRALGREAVAFLDDDRSKHRTLIQRLPVLGGLDQVAQAVRTTGATEVIISSSKVPEASVQDLAALCGELGVTVVRASLKLE